MFLDLIIWAFAAAAILCVVGPVLWVLLSTEQILAQHLRRDDVERLLDQQGAFSDDEWQRIMADHRQNGH